MAICGMSSYGSGVCSQFGFPEVWFSRLFPYSGGSLQTDFRLLVEEVVSRGEKDA